jgi:hypothetical protein
MKTIITPIRREEIRELAEYYRRKYIGMSIDKVAQREGILLVREADELVAAHGFATAVPNGKRRKRIPSLSHPGEYIVSKCEWETIWQECIVINSRTELYSVHEGVPDGIQFRPTDPLQFRPTEVFVFWHEFYHLGYSPTRNTAKFFHSFSTTGILDAQEERRANEFAGRMEL